MESYEDTITQSQLDSIILTDTLSFDIQKDWIQSMVINEDETDFFYKYVYLKNYTDTSGMIYTLYSYDTLYIINKLVIK